MGKNPAAWSNKALGNYQRARSGPVTITRVDGTSETISALEANRRHSAARRARRKKRATR